MISEEWVDKWATAGITEADPQDFAKLNPPRNHKVERVKMKVSTLGEKEQRYQCQLALAKRLYRPASA